MSEAVQTLLAEAAVEWFKDHDPPTQYSTSENEFLQLAEDAYFARLHIVKQ